MVLNLIINGLPSKLPVFSSISTSIPHSCVLNLIINGLPSKLKMKKQFKRFTLGFKPYYKWITF